MGIICDGRRASRAAPVAVWSPPRPILGGESTARTQPVDRSRLASSHVSRGPRGKRPVLELGVAGCHHSPHQQACVREGRDFGYRASRVLLRCGGKAICTFITPYSTVCWDPLERQRPSTALQLDGFLGHHPGQRWGSVQVRQESESRLGIAEHDQAVWLPLDVDDGQRQVQRRQLSRRGRRMKRKFLRGRAAGVLRHGRSGGRPARRIYRPVRECPRPAQELCVDVVLSVLPRRCRCHVSLWCIETCVQLDSQRWLLARWWRCRVVPRAARDPKKFPRVRGELGPFAL
ncbi:hypothetical protein ANAPC5_01094 [Anaplasma phagocytophilum]|nr:hypothetical protein ANAPC5_01094 [Anaplasma phagocytophilum]